MEDMFAARNQKRFLSVSPSFPSSLPHLRQLIERDKRARKVDQAADALHEKLQASE
jgi:hypothetical protein